MSEILTLQIVVIVCGTTAFVASLRFLRRYLELRHDQRERVGGDDLSGRVQNIERTVESTAIEVERIAEANRFVAKLLAERATTPSAPIKSPERVITPH